MRSASRLGLSKRRCQGTSIEVQPGYRQSVSMLGELEGATSGSRALYRYDIVRAIHIQNHGTGKDCPASHIRPRVCRRDSVRNPIAAENMAYNRL